MNEGRRGVGNAAKSTLEVLLDNVAALLQREICKIEEFTCSIGPLLDEPYLLAFGSVSAAGVEQCHVVAGED